jgi:hypothetical protein
MDQIRRKSVEPGEGEHHLWCNLQHTFGFQRMQGRFRQRSRRNHQGALRIDRQQRGSRVDAAFGGVHGFSNGAGELIETVAALAAALDPAFGGKA